MCLRTYHLGTNANSPITEEDIKSGVVASGRNGVIVGIKNPRIGPPGFEDLRVHQRKS